MYKLENMERNQDNMQPFNLDRFKAGEPAYHKITLKEFFYFGDLPGGRIAVKYLNHDVWVCYSTTIQILNDVYYMKEKELTWEEVFNWANDYKHIEYKGKQFVIYLRWRHSDIEYRTPLSEWLDTNFEPPKLKNK